MDYIIIPSVNVILRIKLNSKKENSIFSDKKFEIQYLSHLRFKNYKITSIKSYSLRFSNRTKNRPQFPKNS